MIKILTEISAAVVAGNALDDHIVLADDFVLLPIAGDLLIDRENDTIFGPLRETNDRAAAVRRFFLPHDPIAFGKPIESAGEHHILALLFRNRSRTEHRRCSKPIDADEQQGN